MDAILTLKLDQPQRRALASIIRFVKRPPAITPSRWRVMELGAASSIADYELAALQNSGELGKLDVASFLRAVESKE